MKTRHAMPRKRFSLSALAFAVLLLLVISTLPSFAIGGGGGGHPGNSPGRGPCWGGRNRGHRGGGCGKRGGSPEDEINTFTGDLTIQDMPVYYEGPGNAIPFEVAFSAQASRSGPLGDRWTHSWNTYIVDNAPYGATVVEGNGRETYFTGSGPYTPPPGIFDILTKTVDGWTLARPSNEVLTFNSSGKLTQYADADGLTWTLAYTSGRLTTITDPLTRQTTLTYTSYGGVYYLTRVTVPGGLYAQFQYDTYTPRRLTHIIDAAGYDYTFGYSGTRVTSITDPTGSEVWYTYGTFNNKTVVTSTGITNVSGATVTYDYTSQTNGQLYTDITEQKDGLDRVTRHIHEFDTDETDGAYYSTLLATVVDVGGLNLAEAWTYDSQLRMATHRDSYAPETEGKDHVHHYVYADASNPDKVTKYIDPENYSAAQGASSPGYAYQYDSRGNKSKETTPAGRVTDYTYYTGTDRLYQVIIRDEDVNGNPVNRTTSYTYYPSGDPAYRRYQLKTMTDGRGNVTTYTYDSSYGYLYTVTPASGGATTYGHNAAGDVTSVTDGNGSTTSYAYDGIHRQTVITYPSVGNGQKTRVTAWTCCGMDSVTDENGRVTKYLYQNYTNRLWKVIEDYGGLNYVTEYTYDEVGNLKTEKNARGYTTTYWYDDGDRKTQADYPDSTHEYWTYRDDGRVWTHTDGRGLTTTYRYDADDRLAGSGSYFAINYQGSTTDVKIARDRDGLITGTVDASGTMSYGYYPSQWLRSTWDVGLNKVVTYQYNGVGLVSRLTTPESTSFDYTYNARNQLASLTNPSEVTVNFEYDSGGRRTYVSRPGSNIGYSYNARDWITAVRNRTGAEDEVVLYDASYYYNDGALWDHTGNPLRRVENFGGSDFTTTLRYDNVYRETEETKRDSGGGLVYTHLYSYDEVGNRIGRNDGGTRTLYHGYDANNKLSYTRWVGGGQPPGPITANFYYDGAGNMTSVTGTEFGAKTLTYDDESRLSSIAYGAVTDSYAYNWQGLRTRAYLNGTWYRYLYNGERVLQELTDAGAVTATYTTENDSYYGTLLHLKRATGESRFPLYDSIGSARGLVDASGTVTDTYDMDTFGKPIGSTGSTPNPYRYGAAWGYMTDPSGFLQLGARYYWPEVGRFVSQDPVRVGRNWYSYVENGPLVDMDPSGEVGPAVIAAGAAVACGLIAIGGHELHESHKEHALTRDLTDCMKSDRPAGQKGGPWQHPNNSNMQCWHEPVKPCGKGEEERTYKVCVRRKAKKGWGDWQCGRRYAGGNTLKG